MRHNLSSIRIVNFKSLIDCNFKLSDYTPLVGYNNAGKSNIIHAIKWLFQKSSLSTEDFKDPTKPVEVIGVIEGITKEILEQLDIKHKKAIEKFINNGCITIKRVQEIPAAKSPDIKLQVRKIEFTPEEDEWAVNPTGIDNAISSLFPEPIHVGAMENAEEDVSKSKTGTTIGKLLSRIVEPIEKKYGADLKKQLSSIGSLLDADSDSRAPELNEFDSGMNDKIDIFFQGVKVKVHVPTPELKEVFGKGTLKVFESDRIGGKDVSSLGHGAQRSIQMALIQHLSELQKFSDNDPSRTLLLIDEPELYLHPQAIEVIRHALKTLSKNNYQIIFSTHSALLITEKDMPSTILVRKSTSDGTHKKPTLHEAVIQTLSDRPSQTKLLFSLGNSSKLLFSETVILAEGKTENRLLPIIFESIKGISLGKAKVALIEQGGSGDTKKSMEILKVMGLPNKAIVDLDYAFKSAIDNKTLSPDDEDCIKCKQILSDLADGYNIILDNSGWPTKKDGSLTAAEAFAILAKDQRAKDSIDSLHKKLKEHNIWLWKYGTIEHHLGLTQKNELAWAEFANKIEITSPEELILDYDGVKECMEWLMN
ncbi:MAG: hypothetical protein BGO70_07260 [Bacteroidetes bacterium 43-93]|nr:AAA family ATPase [Bacteroidota bacterium]OJW97578.1 MAG: hypothetical protein BGO70_07260 [Bacteroidetes bacterium 43-93]